jgi:hypothetical protein
MVGNFLYECFRQKKTTYLLNKNNNATRLWGGIVLMHVFETKIKNMHSNSYDFSKGHSLLIY